MLQIAKELKDIGLRVFAKTGSNYKCLFIESKDGYAIKLNIMYGMIHISSSYSPTQLNGNGETLHKDLSKEQLLSILSNPIEPSFWVQNAGKRYTIEQAIEESIFEYEEK